MIGIADYQMYRSNVTDNSLRDQTQQIQTQHQTGTYARGLWNQYTDPIEGENLMKIIILCSYEKTS